MEERIDVHFPSIKDMPKMESEISPLGGYSESVMKRFSKWAKYNYGCVVVIIVESENAKKVRDLVVKYCNDKCDGRPQMRTEFAGAEGNDDGIFCYFKTTVWILQQKEACELSETIKAFCRL